MVVLTHRSSFNCFQFHPLPPLLRRLGEGASRNFCSVPLPPLKTHNSFCFKVCSLTHSTSVTRNICDFPNKRRPGHELSNSFGLLEKFCRTYEELSKNKICKFSRHIVRSDLSVTGSVGSSYPLPEIQAGSKLRGICFYAVTSFVAIFLFVLMVVSHPFVLLFDRYNRKAQHLIAKWWASLTIAPFFNIKFEGLENLPAQDSPAVYVSNHQSFLDIYTLLTLGRSFKFISKTSIFLFPIIGWAMYLLGTIPLKRMDSRSQLDCLRRCMDLVKKGASVFFFPEGTRSRNGTLGTFKVMAVTEFSN
ncbi:OLC1v1035538C4 [Oldenlandia corymbosa var. corymbosa]|uniref:OLC1v1035538C4 n=1 Tax=Oldenlandia corymbosa var. corymbosa TaxID=529605 RepID=A0AAV1CTZ0_OLDCO|nr:OLC1v1035538C4 [Oldenlandia corymbosa var. corymbosa]